jgi:hypothetical protein
VLSIDSASVTTLEGMNWRPFSGVGEATFTILGGQTRREERDSRRGMEEEEEEANLMVSTISFIQANLQHSIAASRILTRTVGDKGIDMALIQEPW